MAGALRGLAGALVFAPAHAVVIVPIWTRMGSGLLLGTIAGAAAGWAFAELEAGYTSLRPSDAIVTGARFGATLWLLVTPVTAPDALLRVLGIAPRLEQVAVGVAVVLALGSGAVYARRRANRRRAILAGALATMALTTAMAGPVPVGRSPRSWGIFVAVLPATMLAGVVLAVVARALGRHRTEIKPSASPSA